MHWVHDGHTVHASSDGTVAPPAALTGKPKALAGRSISSVPSLEAWNHCAAVGHPDALGAGGSGAAPPSAGAGAAGDPNFNTEGIALPLKPASAALFHPVRMSLKEFRWRVANELESLAKFHVPRGKNRRGFKRKALALRLCAATVRFASCKKCGHVDPASALIESPCDMRVCPTCARRRANIARTHLDEKWCADARPRDMGLYLLTFTLRYDPNSPDDLSVDGLKRRKKIVRDAVGFVWRHYLKARGRAMAISLEVSPRGAVHIHALYHGRRPDAGILRETYMFRAGDSPFVNCEYVRKPGKAIRELAKYMMKAASPKSPRILRGGPGEFIDPVLAARAEVAFSGDRLFECMGAWRGADDDSDLPEQAPRICPHCGANTWRCEVASLEALLPQLPVDWVPRFGRAGPSPKKTIRPRGKAP